MRLSLLVVRRATFNEHIVHYRELPMFKYQYDFVRDVLVDIFRWVGVYVKKEIAENFLIDLHGLE